MKTVIPILLNLLLAGTGALRVGAQCAFDPTVEGDLLVCPESANILSTQQYDSYQWYSRPFPNGTAQPVSGATAQTHSVDYNETPVYISVAATLNGCTEQSPEVLVDGLAFIPVVVSSVGDFEVGPDGEQIICVGDTIWQIVLPPYTTNIQWYDGNNPISGANDDTLAVTQPGNYWVTASPGECPGYVATLGVQISVIWGSTPGCTTGTGEPALPLDAVIMPNPAQSSLIVSTDELDPVQLTLFDAAGKALRRLEFRVAIELHTGDLPAGMYTLSLQSKQKRLTRQVNISRP